MQDYAVEINDQTIKLIENAEADGVTVRPTKQYFITTLKGGVHDVILQESDFRRCFRITGDGEIAEQFVKVEEL